MYIIQLFVFLWLLLSGESVFALFGFGGGASAGDGEQGAEMVFEDSEYGVDCSYPIHHKLNTKSPYPVKAMWAEKYAKMMQGCYDTFSFRECDSNERARIEMNFDQPRSQHNYTEIGFKKMRAPQSAWEPLIAFWEQHKKQERAEGWPRGNTYVNNWEVASYMISLEDKTLEGGLNVKEKVWDAVRPILEEWTGKELSPTSLYGIRIYKEGAVLASHVDRLPLVSSAIIQIAQDLDEPWPIEVYSHAGKAYNVTMEPGDMVLYESHTVLHGRPFPLVGRSYANVFVHYIPVDHDEENKKDADVLKYKKDVPPAVPSWAKPNKGSKKAAGGHEADNHDEETIRRHMEKHDLEHGAGANHLDGRTALHEAAAEGDLDTIETLLKNQNTALLNARDANEWQAIHEAARAGKLDALKFLVDLGADIGARSNNGGTPLWWAKRSLPADHPVISYLIGIGAPAADEVRG